MVFFFIQNTKQITQFPPLQAFLKAISSHDFFN